MDDVIDMMISNESPADISDKIKEILMQKSAENIESLRPIVAASMFNNQQDAPEQEIDYIDTEESEEETMEDSEEW